MRVVRAVECLGQPADRRASQPYQAKAIIRDSCMHPVQATQGHESYRPGASKSVNRVATVHPLPHLRLACSRRVGGVACGIQVD